MIYKNNILGTVGNTPLVKLNRINKGLKPQIFAKLESFNPGGSVKDRIGISMLDDAEEKGLIKPGGTVIEATSGNTGIGLALACAVKGYKSVFVVTDKVSSEKINYLKALGGEVIVVSNAVPHDHPDYYVTVAKRINDETPNSVFMYQYSNPANPEIHYKTTGPEIWEQTNGKITHFISGIGTGGTISGTGRYLKEMDKKIKVIGADPFGSIFKEYKTSGKISSSNPYLVEGIGQDCLPKNVNFEYIDEIINVTDKDSFHYARMLSREEGIFCGGSTGTIVKVTLDVAKDLDENAIIVFIVTDTGERYLSKFHNEEWLREKRLLPDEVRTIGDVIRTKKNRGAKELVTLNPNDKVKKAIDVFNQYGYTQVPVLDDGKCVGSLREGRVMSRILNEPDVMNSNVSEVMGECFPVLDLKSEIKEARMLLSDSPAILVSEYSRIIDIITRYDILEYSNLS